VYRIKQSSLNQILRKWCAAELHKLFSEGRHGDAQLAADFFRKFELGESGMDDFQSLFHSDRILISSNINDEMLLLEITPGREIEIFVN